MNTYSPTQFYDTDDENYIPGSSPTLQSTELMKIGNAIHDCTDAITSAEDDILTKADKSFSRYVAITTTGWTATAPYSKTVNVLDVTSDVEPFVDVMLNGTTAEKKAQQKAFDLVSEIITNDGSITVYCYDYLPSVNFTLRVKVVG